MWRAKTARSNQHRGCVRVVNNGGIIGKSTAKKQLKGPKLARMVKDGLACDKKIVEHMYP